MPFKQKAKKNKEGSSSSAPARRDLANRYKAPFPIYTMEEGERYTRLAKCNFIDDTEMAIKFRVDGEELTVDYDKMHQWLGFPKNGCASKPKGWNASSVWEILMGQSTFTPQNAGNKWIKDESILYLHKYLCYALFGRVEASKVQTRDLFVLECILQVKRVDVAGMVLDTIYNASRHQGKVTLGVGSMAPILAYVARMPIPPYQPQPTDTFRYMDGAFLKKTGLVEEVKTGTTVLYRWKPWERRVGHSDRDEGTSEAQTQRQRKGKAPVTSSSHAEEEEDEVAGWKQVLGKVEALQQLQETLQVTVFDMGQKLHTIQKNHERMERKWMKYFHHQNIEFAPSPPGSPEA
ncbi:hypothetical protein JCGZ_01699 [Jatropha curcas]|uniref:Arabidopsis retrotransposon Orf1 C-terminal domain-containing protein n=1 Tax=Jatropha curcas TaxID=180498 RepID=A0A067JGK0_JATCU|nr:hypothetical protein JCGZ_01699 [Jatropha curcas]